MKKYNILDILYNEPERTPPYIDFDITVTDDDGNSIQLISDSTFKDFLRGYYFSFMFLTPSYFDTVQNREIELIPTVSDAGRYLGYRFNQWKADRQHGFLRLYEALMAKYNPIHNYDKTIHSTMEYDGKEKNEFTKSGTETSQAIYGEEQNIESKTPYDSGTFLDNTKNVTPTHTDTSNLNFTNRKDTSERSFTDRVDVYDYRESGNIGVTTTQQMITSQFPLTDLDSLKRYIVNLFVHENLIL